MTKTTKPYISIITPTFNQRRFIESNIHSVLRQRYPYYEHIIVDNCSTDGTMMVVKKYKHLKWISEQDSGQTEAINKGFRESIGDILFWLNGDDVLIDDKLFESVAQCFNHNPSIGIIYCNYRLIDENGKKIYDIREINFNRNVMLFGPNIIGMSAFIRRYVYNAIGPLDESLHYVMDYEYWMRADYANVKFKRLPLLGIGFRYHEVSKTVSKKHLMRQEKDKIRVLFISKYNPSMLMYRKPLYYYYRFIRQLLKLLQSGVIDIPFRNAFHRYRAGR
jgi:glycosyltransferase involved in cell wall biosynthesis